MANILVVDDQECVRQWLMAELTLEGHRVVCADGAESVSAHLRFPWPDLVLLDLYLDEADGFGAFHEIKKLDPNVPVIIFTAYDSYREDPCLSQADGYVIKSLLLDELKGKIGQVLLREQQTLEKPAQAGPRR